MRRLLFAVALAALATTSANAAKDAKSKDWVAVCTDGKDAQYTQTIGGVGYFHLGDDNGSYQTLRVSQTFYDGTAVCGAVDTKLPPGATPIGQVCANKSRETIYFKYRDAKDTNLPDEKVGVFCKAMITEY
jgi:hypothetical protein